MKRQLVDPVHLFDHTGHSIMSGRYLQARNDDLTRENERLRAIIRRFQQRLKQTESDIDKLISN
jgi:hemerythrin-like domain-containing protein